MGDIPSNTLENCASALASAAESLVKLAATLSEATQALSTASKTLSIASSLYSSHPARSAPAGGSNLTNPIDRDVDPGPVLDQTSLTTTTEPNNKGIIKPNQSYHILVDNEADVLLFVCALIRNCQKVACYMSCDLAALRVYKKLFKSIIHTKINVFNGAKLSTLITHQQDFLSNKKSILLISETDVPDIMFRGDDTWAIHVGWPYDIQRYEDQKAAHQARNNVFVAYSEDQALYPSSATILERSEPWSPGGESFNTSVKTLRPLFEEQLAKIPPKRKEKIYRSWIHFHGPCGPRYISAWSASTLVYRANLYILDALKYENSGSKTSRPTVQVPLPEVPAAFVAYNHLESAVEEGVLQVQFNSFDPSSLSREGFPPADTVSLNESTSAGVTGLAYDPHAIPDNTSSPDLNNKSSVNFHDNSPWGSNVVLDETYTATDALTHREDFQPTLGRTYFTIENESDIIPLICFMAQRYNRLVCFLDEPGSICHYQSLFSKITGQLVISPRAMNDENACEQAVHQFSESTTGAMLLLTHPTKKMPVPPALKEISIGCCIYWGYRSPSNPVIKAILGLSCPAISAIMTRAQRDKFLGRPRLTDWQEHPSVASLLDTSEHSLLWPMRDATRLVLASDKKLVKNLYTTRLYFFGKVPRRVLNAEEVVHRANHYAATILLHGDRDDECDHSRSIAERPSVSQSIVKKFDLQPAVDAGLLTVG